jgi:predicted transposase YbfD/YdcC
LQQVTEGDIVPIDGKTVRRSGTASQKAMHLVSAWSKANGIVLGQISTEEKSNEITAIPKLIESLALEGCIVTIDAMGCQTEIAQAIVDKGAHYLLSVKDNQKGLHDELKSHFDAPVIGPALRTAESTDKGHGRIEVRRISVSDDVEALVEAERWPALSSVIRVDSERIVKEKTSYETRYFISSLPKPSAEEALNIVRSHWEIENKLHWCLDVTMNEDGACLRDRQLAENGSTIRRMAMNALRIHPDFKGNLAQASRNVAFDPGYREKLMLSLISNA